MSPGQQNRRGLEEHWYQEMKGAHAIYLEASAQHERVIGALGQVAAVDAAVSSARNAAARALREYVRTIDAYLTVVRAGQPESSVAVDVQARGFSVSRIPDTIMAHHATARLRYQRNTRNPA